MNIIFIAAPAAGKGTQAGLLKSEYGLYHLSTGDVLREMSSSNTELGNKVKSLIDNGLLIDDELMLRILKEKISSIDNNKGIIFDGFPRTIKQAEMLDELMGEINQKIDYVIFLEIEKEVAMKRATGRVSCSNCNEIYNIYFDTFKANGKCNKCNGKLVHREDDTKEKFNHRFDAYLEKTEPVIEYYRNKGLLSIIKCTDSKEEVYEMIKSVINKKAE